MTSLISGESTRSTHSARNKPFSVTRIASALLLAPLFVLSYPALGVVTGGIVTSGALPDASMTVSKDFGDLAMGPEGDVTAVWIGKPGTATTYSLYAVRRYPSLDLVAPGVQVSQNPVERLTPPRVKTDALNRFVVAWAGADTDGTGVYFRCYEADTATTARIDATRANDIETGAQNFPSLVMNADGSFTLLWQYAAVAGTSPSYTAIHARDFTADCTPVDVAYAVYTAPAGSSLVGLEAAGDSAGDPVLAWRETDGAAWQVKAQRLGSPQVPAFTIASGTTITSSSRASVATSQAADGDFVVSWVAQGTLKTLYAQRYNASGVAVDGPALVYSNSSLNLIDTAMDALGRFSAALTIGSVSQQAYVRQYDTAMAPLYDAQNVVPNSGIFFSLALASDADGDLVMGKTDVSLASFNGMRLAGPEPVDVAVAIENNPDRTAMDRLELKVTVTNNQSPAGTAGVEKGIGASSGIQVQVNPPAGASQEAAALGDWACDSSFLCTLKKPLPAGATQQFGIHFTNVALGSASSTSQLTSHHVDPVSVNDSSSVDTRLCNDYGTIEFTAADPNVTVSEGSATYTASVQRTGGTCGVVSARVTTPASGLSAVAETDYTSIDQLIAWADGDSSIKTVSIPIIDDNVVDGDKEFEVNFAQITSATAGANSQLLVTIQDDDVNTPATSAPSTGGGSGGGGSFDPSLLFLCAIPWLARRRFN